MATQVRDGRVRISTEDAVAVLELNRPEKLNAFDLEQIDALEAALRWLAEEDSVRAAVLTGSDRAFSVGGDISTFDEIDAEHAFSYVRRGYDILRPLETGEKPVIAAVEGHCLAGGLEVALACEFIICGEGSRFALPEVTLGLLPGWGGIVRLVRAIPTRRARQLLLTGERIEAEEALSLGIVNEIVGRGGALERATALAGEIAANPPVAVRAVKMAAEAAADAASMDAALAVERTADAVLFGTEAVHEASRSWGKRDD